MLRLQTPITIGAKLYARLVCVKGGFDLRTRKIEIVLSLAREKDGRTILATKEKDGETSRILAPPIVGTLTLQDATPSDPALAGVFQKLHELSEAIESVLATSGQLDTVVYQSGEEDVVLTSTFQASETPPTLEEKVKI